MSPRARLRSRHIKSTGLEILHQIRYSVADLVGEGSAISSIRKGDDVAKLTVLYNLPEVPITTSSCSGARPATSRATP
jgi:hypothetical protein